MVLHKLATELVTFFTFHNIIKFSEATNLHTQQMAECCFSINTVLATYT